MTDQTQNGGQAQNGGTQAIMSDIREAITQDKELSGVDSVNTPTQDMTSSNPDAQNLASVKSIPLHVPLDLGKAQQVSANGDASQPLELGQTNQVASGKPPSLEKQEPLDLKQVQQIITPDQTVPEQNLEDGQPDQSGNAIPSEASMPIGGEGLTPSEIERNDLKNNPNLATEKVEVGVAEADALPDIQQVQDASDGQANVEKNESDISNQPSLTGNLYQERSTKAPLLKVPPQLVYRRKAANKAEKMHQEQTQAISDQDNFLEEQANIDNVLSDNSARASSKAIRHLHRSIRMGNQELTLEQMVRADLHPMLKEWLDSNLPKIVNELVDKEIERITKEYWKY